MRKEDDDEPQHPTTPHLQRSFVFAAAPGSGSTQIGNLCSAVRPLFMWIRMTMLSRMGFSSFAGARKMKWLRLLMLVPGI